MGDQKNHEFILKLRQAFCVAQKVNCAMQWPTGEVEDE